MQSRSYRFNYNDSYRQELKDNESGSGIYGEIGSNYSKDTWIAKGTVMIPGRRVCMCVRVCHCARETVVQLSLLWKRGWLESSSGPTRDAPNPRGRN